MVKLLILNAAARLVLRLKWQANRIRRGLIEHLQLDMANLDFDLKYVQEELKDIITQNEEKNVGFFANNFKI